MDGDRLVGLMVAGAEVHRRYQFFMWLQTHVQAVLPHVLAVCCSYTRHRRALRAELFNTVLVPDSLQRALCDGQSALITALAAGWVEQGGRPMHIDCDTLAGLVGDDTVAELKALGVPRLLVHGVARPQQPAELESLYVLCQTAPMVLDAHLTTLRLLMPYLHSTLQRMLAVEMQLHGQTGVPPMPGIALLRPVLTSRELAVLECVRGGLSNQRIGGSLGISPLTVKQHVQKILRKLGASNRAQAVAKANQFGL